MKRLCYGGMLMVFCLLTMGMGSMGNPASVKTPEPDKNFSVTLVDQDDVSMDLEKFSCEGMTYLTGTLGKSNLSIDFERIRSILFVEAGEQCKAVVSMDNQKQVEIMVKKNTPCFGVSSFADVRIDVGDIKKVVLHGQTKEVQ
jgi:hypothetical protein